MSMNKQIKNKWMNGWEKEGTAWFFLAPRSQENYNAGQVPGECLKTKADKKCPKFPLQMLSQSDSPKIKFKISFGQDWWKDTPGKILEGKTHFHVSSLLGCKRIVCKNYFTNITMCKFFTVWRQNCLLNPMETFPHPILIFLTIANCWGAKD